MGLWKLKRYEIKSIAIVLHALTSLEDSTPAGEFFFWRVNNVEVSIELIFVTGFSRSLLPSPAPSGCKQVRSRDVGVKREMPASGCVYYVLVIQLYRVRKQ